MPFSCLILKEMAQSYGPPVGFPQALPVSETVSQRLTSFGGTSGTPHPPPVAARPPNEIDTPRPKGLAHHAA